MRQDEPITVVFDKFRSGRNGDAFTTSLVKMVDYSRSTCFLLEQASLCEFSAYDFIRVVFSLHKDLVLVSSLYFSYKIENYAKSLDVRLEHER